MPVALIVRGIVEHGRLGDFRQAAGEFARYRAQQGMAVPEVLYGMSGPMNSVALLLRYKTLADYEREYAAEHSDPEYTRLASAMPFVAGSIHYELYSAEPAAPA